jgi:hypothetical protein
MDGFTVGAWKRSERSLMLLAPVQTAGGVQVMRIAMRAALRIAMLRVRVRKQTPPPLEEQDFNSSIQKKESKTGFSQADFDARDLRKMHEAQKELDMRCRSLQGSRLPAWMEDERATFEWICRKAGISVERALELENRQKKWPDKVPEWAQQPSPGSA